MFLCFLNLRVVKVAMAISASLAVAPLIRHLPQRRPESQIQKGVDSDFFLLYFPGRRRENKSRVIISQVSCMRELLVDTVIPVV